MIDYCQLQNNKKNTASTTNQLVIVKKNYRIFLLQQITKTFRGWPEPSQTIGQLLSDIMSLRSVNNFLQLFFANIMLINNFFAVFKEKLKQQKNNKRHVKHCWGFFLNLKTVNS